MESSVKMLLRPYLSLLILLPKLARYDAMNLEDMVREVNTDGVSREEVLSDKVYIYRRSDGFITMSF